MSQEIGRKLAASTRSICYIDGFNLFYGLRHAGWRHLYWLDIQRLGVQLLRGRSVLAGTKYFTARIRGSHPKDSPAEGMEREAKRRRQNLYLEALGTLRQVSIVEGMYRDTWIKCKLCKGKTPYFEEKQTDVALAAELLSDAFLARFDHAFIVSGDSDLVPAINAVRTHFPNKSVTVVFPPGRVLDALKFAAGSHLHLNEAMLRAAQFPEVVQRHDGYSLKRPAEWN